MARAIWRCANIVVGWVVGDSIRGGVVCQLRGGAFQGQASKRMDEATDPLLLKLGVR